MSEWEFAEKNQKWKIPIHYSEEDLKLDDQVQGFENLEGLT